jgi:hypothetical protein
MTVTDLIMSAQFVVDDRGHKRAVLLDFTVWEEIVAKLSDLEDKGQSDDDLLALAGTWAGDDLEDCLEEVYAHRTEAIF